MDASLHRIVRVSRWMFWLATVGLVLLVVTFVSLIVLTGVFMLLSSVPAWLEAHAVTVPEFGFSQTGLTPVKLWMSALFLALTLIPVLYLLGRVRGLFRLYARAEIFSRTAAAKLKQIGTALLVLAAVSVLSHTGMVLIATFDNPPGQKALSLSIDSADYMLVLLGGLISIIGWVMEEAAGISDENRQFV